jgi:hypothetical protein
MYLSSLGTFWRCFFSVCLLVLFVCRYDADTLETLALVVGLPSVGKHLALSANSFSLCIQCFRGIEENARVHMIPRQNERANSCTKWGFECFSFAKFFPDRSTAILLRRSATRKTKEINVSICLQLTIINFVLHGLIRITWMRSGKI